MSGSPIVSVVIPVFNNEGTIAAAIESALAQRFDRPFEVIVVNDGSTDRTGAILATFGDRISVIDHGENCGPSKARNSAINVARGKYIAFLDADDTWDSDKLALTTAPLDADPQCGLVYSDARRVDGAGRSLTESYIPPKYARAPSLDDLLREPWWYILPSMVVMRKTVLLSVGGFNEELDGKGHGGEDALMWILAREQCSFRLIEQSPVSYRVPNIEEDIRKRIQMHTGLRNSPDPLREFWKSLEWNQILIAILRRRYGARVRHLTRHYQRTYAGLLETMGLQAMYDDDPRLARANYAASLRLYPWQWKIWARVIAATVPRGVGRALRDALPKRFARPFWGPPKFE